MGCGDACPIFPGKRYEDWDLADPDGLGVDAVRPIRDEIGRLIGASSIARDITEQKQLRAAAERDCRAGALERANRSLESFIYSVSHDLRAPLHALGGFSGILLEDYGDVLGEDGRDYAERIQGASARMAQLIDDLLDLSRLARAEVENEAVDLSQLANSVAEELRHSDPSRTAEILIAPGL